MIDRNKSQLTHDVTEAVMQYLDVCGFKPVETEVNMPRCQNNCERGWIADVAGVIYPTQTELIEMRFLKRPPSWNEMRSTTRSEAKRIEAQERMVIWREQRDALLRRMTCLVEVKTSRSDFCGDRKWKLKQWPTDLAYVAVPKGMIRPEEYPEGWGILEYSEGGIKRVRVPTPQAVSIKHHLYVIYAVAIRRDHRTRYADTKAERQADRIAEGEEITLRRINDVIRMVTQVACGEHGSVEMVLERHRIKAEKIPHYDMERLRKLWNVAKKEDM